MTEIYQTKSPNEKIAICIGVTGDLTFAAAITFLNFAKLHGTKDYVFYLFSDRVDKKSIKILGRAGLEVVPIIYKPDLPWTALWSSRSIAYFSPMVLSKIEGLRLVQKHPTVLWLDYDIVIKKPLDKLLFGQGFDVAYIGSGKPISHAFTDPEAILEISSMSGPSMHASIICFRNQIASPGPMLLQAYKYVNKYSRKLYLPEQGVFDLVFTKFSVITNFLEEKDYGCHPLEPCMDSASIIHSVGPKKFWSGLENDEWNELEKSWKLMGGNGFSSIRSSVALSIRKAKHIVAIFAVNMNNFPILRNR